MRIVGIDPGLKTTGIGVVESLSVHDVRPLDWMTIETSGMDTPARLQELHADLDVMLTMHRPQLAVVERLFFATNQKTAMDVAQARGVILLTLGMHGIPVLEPTPLQLKAAITGDGKADKRQMQAMLVRMLNLGEAPQPADAADALALAVYGALMQGHLVSSKLEARNNT